MTVDLRDKLFIGDANKEKSIVQRNKEMIKAMYQNGIEIDMIVKISGLDKGEVEKIIKEK